MEVVCPNCGTPGQEAGKFCENCGFSIPVDAGQPAPAAQGGDTTIPVDPSGQGAAQAPQAAAAGPVSQAGAQPGGAVRGAQFAVVRNGQPDLNQGFTISRVGEFLVGREDQETGHQVDIDLRQWVQPIDVGGQKQYLIHRQQCYLGLADGGVVTLRMCPGAEADTLVKAPGEAAFTSIQDLGEHRTARPDGSFELQVHDQVFMGDPEAVTYYLTSDPTAQDNYLVIELINKSLP